jgi:uncharacterized protein (DUF2235 family)
MTPPPGRKRIVICCDGTWSVPDQRCDGGQPCPTNVTKTAMSVLPQGHDGVTQAVYYGRGIGTGRWDHLVGGAFGVGISEHLLDAYAFLIDEYVPGDELFLFGFSRGAYTARSLAGLVRNCGIVKREFRDRVPEAYALYRRRDDASKPAAVESQLFRKTYTHEADAPATRVRFIGVWDTVGALGIPIGALGWISRRVLHLQFHDVNLSSYVDNAFQALAIDERRRAFRPAVWTQQPHAKSQRLEQVWFAGVHSNVGGGNADPGLSDLAFLWMRDRATECGLEFDLNAVTTRADFLGPISESWRGIYRVALPRRREIAATGAPVAYEYAHWSPLRRREESAYDPPNLPPHPVVSADSRAPDRESPAPRAGA